MSATLELAGMTFGRLTVIGRTTNTAAGKARWACRCDCGTERVVTGADIRNGHTQSCGCFRVDVAREKGRIQKHGLTGTREYRAWSAAKKRCYNPHSDSFENYGARGIAMCDEWRASFEQFFADMGTRPSGHSLDRIDTNGPYAQWNCRWATASQQNSNRRPFTRGAAA